jgi:hypothetical protein
MTPEQRARQQIDLLLQQCGWIVQNRSETNLAAGPGVAIREALLKTVWVPIAKASPEVRKYVELSRAISQVKIYQSSATA